MVYQDAMRLVGEYELKTDEERIQVLADIVEQGSQSPYIREFTIGLLNKAGIKSYDYIGEIDTIFRWVRDNITYRRHVLCRDSFTTAERVLKLRAGDCDNMSVLLNSMLMSVGIPAGFRLVSSDVRKPFHHIYSIAGVPPTKPIRWIPLDPIIKHYRMGQEGRFAKKRDFIVICGR